MRRTVGLTLLLLVLAVAVGSFVAVETFPSKGQLQKMSLESLGVNPQVLQIPFVQQILDDATGKVQDRVVDKARKSAIEGGAAAVVVALVGAILIESDRRRRPVDGAAAPAEAAAVPPPPPAAPTPPPTPPPASSPTPPPAPPANPV